MKFLSMTVCVHIRGIVGSDKSWICKQLREMNILCIDTDNVLQEVFVKLRESSPKFQKLLRSKWSDKDNWWKTMSRTGKKEIERTIQRKREDGISVVVVGNSISEDIGGVDKTFFIKMSERALGQAYRRLMLRELEKIVGTSHATARVIQHENLYEIGAILSNITTPSYPITFGTSFEIYEEYYQEWLGKAEKSGYIIMTQPEILKTIVSEVFSSREFSQSRV